MTPRGVLELIDATQALIDWFAEYEPGRLERPGFKRLIAANVAARASYRETGDPVRMARRDGPVSSKIAAVRVAPTVGSRQEEVLERLREAGGEWVDGSELSTAECGGSEGKRRLRELREDKGWDIETRPHPGSATAWQYRLMKPDPDGTVAPADLGGG
ncbi:MAG TPA: hypothetical protein VMX12_03190 [Acidimicrobiia bacterium]|nr:hypothetical protein [Acidimicrobiia bacterium]